MKQYKTICFTTGVFSGNISGPRLERDLNHFAAQGWWLRTTIRETRRMLLIFRREVHVLVFERDAPDEKISPMIEATNEAPSGMRVLTEAELQRM